MRLEFKVVYMYLSKPDERLTLVSNRLEDLPRVL